MENDKLVKDSFNDYIHSLIALKEQLNEMRIQTQHTNKAVMKLLESTHLNAVLKMTRESEFRAKIGL